MELVAAFPIMFAGTYWLFRRWGFPQDAAALGGMLLAFSGFDLSHFIHPSMILVLAHVPWLLACIDVLLREPDRSRAAWAWLGISLLTASELLTAFPQTLWFSLICESAYSLLLILRHGRLKRALALRRRKTSGRLGRIAATAADLAVVVAVDSTEPTVEFTTSFSLHPAFLLQFLVPSFFRNFLSFHEFMLFDGAVTLALCAMGCVSLAAFGSTAGDRDAGGRRRPPRPVAGPGRVLAQDLSRPAVLALRRQVPLPLPLYFLRPFRHGGGSGSGAGGLGQAGCRPPATGAVLVLAASRRQPDRVCGGRGQARCEIAWVSEFLAPPWQMLVGVGLIVAAVGAVVAAGRGSRWALAGIIVFAAVERAIYLTPVFGGAMSTSFREFADGVLVPPAPTRHRVLVEEEDCWNRPRLAFAAFAMPAVTRVFNRSGHGTIGSMRPPRRTR